MIKKLIGGGIALALGGIAYAYVETKRFVLREATIPLLPQGQPPLTILHISDMHLVPRQQLKQDWVRDLATLEPDLVIDTGDNWAAYDAFPAVMNAMEPLLSLPGAFVFGSNDYFAPRLKNPARYLLRDSRTEIDDHPDFAADKLAAVFKAAGWRDLTNRRDSLVADGRRINLVGVDDPHLDRDVFPREISTDAPQPAIDLRLGVSHAPYVRALDKLTADGVDLILTGHTHGGQLCLPVYGALTTNCDLDTRRAKGLSGWPGPRPDAPGGEESTWLHVSAGLGTSPYAPVRFACRPEATLLTLVSTK